MNQMHIRNVDLNLISVFDAIMAEGNLGAAGERLGLSQSAVSHALARLRAITGDELFVRTRKGMRPTPHAVALAGPLQSAVELCRQAFAKRNGVPTLATERTFVIDLPVGFDVVFVPPLLAAMQTVGLGARVWANSDRAVDVLTDLRDGETELALDLDEGDIEATVIAARDGDPIDQVPVPAPCAWLLGYRYPVHLIRRDFQPGEPPAQPTWLLIYRNRADKVQFQALEPLAARLLALVQEESGRCGRELVAQLAQESGHPEPSVLIDPARALLRGWMDRDVIAGVR